MAVQYPVRRTGFASPARPAAPQGPPSPLRRSVPLVTATLRYPLARREGDCTAACAEEIEQRARTARGNGTPLPPLPSTVMQEPTHTVRHPFQVVRLPQCRFDALQERGDDFCSRTKTALHRIDHVAVEA